MEDVPKSAFGKGEVRFTIPRSLLEIFAKEPRVVLKWRPDGLWPIDLAILQKTDLINKLATDKEFNENFEIVIMHKG